MLTLETLAKIDSSGRLTVDMPTALPAGDLLVKVLVPEPDDTTSAPDGTNIAAILKFAGTIKLGVDPMKVQREMRDEWPD